MERLLMTKWISYMDKKVYLDLYRDQLFGAFKYKFESEKWEMFNTSHIVIQYSIPQPSIY